MGDDNKTIAVFEGDASGAKRAAQEVVTAVRSQVSAMEELASAEKAAGAAADEHARKMDLQNQVRARAGKNVSIDLGGGGAEAIHAATEAQEELLDITEEVKASVRTEADILYGVGDAAEDAGGKSTKAFQGGKASAEQYARVLSMIDPRLGALVQGASSLGSVFGLTIGKAAVLAGAVAAIAASAAAIIDSIKLAAQQAKEVIDELERKEEKRREQKAGVGEQLALHGVSEGFARNAAAGYVEALTKKGYSQQTAEITAAAVAAAKLNGQRITDEQMADLAALQESGAAQLTKGTNTAATSKNVLETIRNMGNLTGRNRQSLVAGQEQKSRTQLELIEAINQGNEAAAKKYLMEQQQMSDSQAADRAPALIKAARGEELPVDTENVFGFRVDLTPGTPGYKRVKSVNERMVPQFIQDREQAKKTTGELQERGRAIPASTEADNFRPEENWADALKPPVTAEAPPTQENTEDAKRRERIQGIIKGLEGDVQKATLSPEELLKTQLQELGATQDDIIRAVELQREITADKRPNAQPARPPSTRTAGKTFDPDRQNQPQQINVHNTFSGHTVIGDTKDPRLGRLPRSPVR